MILIFLFIIFITTNQLSIYVVENIEPCSIAICNGSLENPFHGLIPALRFIETSNESTFTLIMKSQNYFITNEMLIENNYTKNSQTFKYEILFESQKEITFMPQDYQTTQNCQSIVEIGIKTEEITIIPGKTLILKCIKFNGIDLNADNLKNQACYQNQYCCSEEDLLNVDSQLCFLKNKELNRESIENQQSLGLFSLLQSTTLTIEDCIFYEINSIHSYDSGAFYSLIFSNNSHANLQIVNLSIINCYFNSGIFNLQSLESLIINDIFAVGYNYYKIIEQKEENCQFIFNSITNTISLTNSFFEHHRLCFGANQQIEIKNTLIQNVTNTDAGGLLYFSESSTIMLNNLTLESGASTQNGGCSYFAQNNTLSFINVSSSNCLSALQGGAFFFSVNCKTNFEGEVFINNNIAFQEGGGLFFDSECEFISNCLLMEFWNNTSDQQGGAIYFNDDVNTIKIMTNGLKFIGNTAKYGGGIYLNSVENQIQIRQNTSLFQNNYANFEGGCFYTTGTASKQNSLVFQCETESNCKFLNNEVGFNGAIFMINKNVNLTMYSIDIKNSLAMSEGGSFYIQSNANIKLYDIIINGSVSGSNGGLMEVKYDSNIEIVNLTAISCVTLGQNGLLGFDSNCQIKISNSSFYECRATRGIITPLKANQLLMQNCYFFNNQATYGGLFKFQIDNNVKLINLQCYGNSAVTGNLILNFIKIYYRWNYVCGIYEYYLYRKYNS